MDLVKAGDDLEFLKRVWASRVPLSFCRQFSVLKFPSVLWRMYALREDYPQTAYAEAMRRHPQRLREQLLVDLAASFSQHTITRNKNRGLTYHTLRRLLVHAAYLYDQ